MPWRDRAGRFSAFKLCVFLLLFLPGLLVAWRFAAGALGPRATNEAIHQIGNWTLRLILLSLAITPGRRILQWPRLMLVRRMVGVAAFAYAAVHLVLYAADQAFDLGKVASEIVLRIYLTIGFVSLLILTALAVTSTDAMVNRLGARRWRRLHALVYAAALLSLVHFFMQTKVAVDEPWIMTGLFAWLMAFRLLVWRGWWVDWLPWALAPLCAAATALGEAVYYRLKLGVGVDQVLLANLMVEPAIRPAWYVLGICLAVALAGQSRQAWLMAGRYVAAATSRSTR